MSTSWYDRHILPRALDFACGLPMLGRQRQLVVPKGNPWLFPGDVPGQPVKEIRRFWINMQKEAKLPEVRIHDLRHTFASHAAMSKETLPMIGRLLGHANHQSTARYAHLDDEHLLDAAQQVGDAVERLMCNSGSIERNGIQIDRSTS